MALGVAIVAVLFILESKKDKKTLVEQETIPGPLGIMNRIIGSQKKESSSSSTLDESPTVEIPLPIRPRPSVNNPKKVEEETKALLEENISKTAELSEIQTKHEKMDKLLKEKNDELEKKTKELDNEVKNRKEFNKVKDLLEKEIKDLRDKNHKFQLEVNAAKTESENYKKRIGQLDEKITQRDNDIKEKEKQIDELVKRMQTFAAPSGATATVEAVPVSPTLPAPQPEKKPTLADLPQKPEQTVNPVQDAPVPDKEPEPIPQQEKNTIEPSKATQENKIKEPEKKESDGSVEQSAEPVSEERPHLNVDILKSPGEEPAKSSEASPPPAKDPDNTKKDTPEVSSNSPAKEQQPKEPDPSANPPPEQKPKEKKDENPSY